MKTLSIIIVTHNSENSICACLDSVFSQSLPDYEVIVVDNNSQDQTKGKIRQKYPLVKLIENNNNFGPAKARNQAISVSSGDFILCLDHDAVLAERSVFDLLKTVNLKADIGAVGPKILLEDRKTVYSKGISVSLLWRFHDLGSGSTDSKEPIEAKDVFGVTATCALYRKQALESVRQSGEYFDEDFFYFFEDVDLSWRLRKKGWRIIFAPKAEVFHKGGRSRNRDKFSQYLCIRNRYLVIMKNASVVSILKFPFVFLAYDLWRIIFTLFTNPKYLFKAISESIKLLPRMINKRKGFN